LAHFLPAWLPTITIKKKWASFDYRSIGSTRDLTNKDIIILINQWSASASEILALSLQDYGVATIIGEQSFWKGSVQTVLEYDQWWALKLTTHKRYSWKSKISISDVGVTPDMEVILSDIDLQQEIDTQLAAALEY
jgi:carboxyl-terminal processing protease